MKQFGQLRCGSGGRAFGTRPCRIAQRISGLKRSCSERKRASGDKSRFGEAPGSKGSDPKTKPERGILGLIALGLFRFLGISRLHGRLGRLPSTALSHFAAGQQVDGNSIEHHESPSRADQEKEFSNDDFHGGLDSIIANKPKKLEPKRRSAGSARRIDVLRKKTDPIWGDADCETGSSAFFLEEKQTFLFLQAAGESQ